jgi:enoyl-CoA hydratase/carnithine racemase
MEREYKRLLCERRGTAGEVLWITLNNEKLMNSLTETMQTELCEVLTEAAADDSVRCLVLTGAGEAAFCSGGDIRLFQQLDHVSGYDYLYGRGNTIQRLITYMEKPVVAAVNGMCFAGGLELALVCDFAYATESAAFGLLEINLGVLAGWGGTVRLPRAIPPARAREMIYRGEIIGAAEALRLGLVNRVLPSRDELHAAVEGATAEMMSKPPLALRAAKNVVNNSLTCESIEAALAIERGSIMWLISSEDSKEGIAAFVEKRTGHFKGR